MKIFREIKENIHSNEYYKKVLESKSLNSSIKYLSKLSLVSAIASAIIMAIILRNMPANIKQQVTLAIAQFPSDLVITLEDGTASMNKSSPFAIPMPMSWYAESKRNIKTENIITIDTDSDFSLDKFKQYKTFALLTKNELVVLNANSGEVRILPVSSFGDHIITHDFLMQKEIWIYNSMPVIATLTFIFMFIGYFIGGFIGTLFALLFYALFVWVLMKVNGIKSSYKKSYQMALHAFTVVVILHLIGLIFPIFENFFLNLVVMLLVVWVNIADYKGKAHDQETA